MVSRETGNSTYANFWREKQRLLWYFFILANGGSALSYQAVVHRHPTFNNQKETIET